MPVPPALNCGALVIVKVYSVKVSPSEITVILKTFSPISSSFSPAPVTSEVAALGSALTVTLFSFQGAFTVYSVLSAEKASLSSAPETVRLLSVESWFTISFVRVIVIL